MTHLLRKRTSLSRSTASAGISAHWDKTRSKPLIDQTAMCYLLGLGSNLEPVANFPKMADALLKIGSRLVVSRVVSTEPVGMVSSNRFLNGVAYLETMLAPADLKLTLNAIETKLGRDRNDPNSKTSDRPADFDILAEINPADLYSSQTVPQEPYCQETLEELLFWLGFLTYKPSISLTGVNLTFGSQQFGLKPQELTN